MTIDVSDGGKDVVPIARDQLHTSSCFSSPHDSSLNCFFPLCFISSSQLVMCRLRAADSWFIDVLLFDSPSETEIALLGVDDDDGDQTAFQSG